MVKSSKRINDNSIPKVQNKQQPSKVKDEPSLEELALESIGESSAGKEQIQDTISKQTTSMNEITLSKTNDYNASRGRENSQGPFIQNKNLPFAKSMGSTLNSTMFKPPISNQPQKIIISKDVAIRAKEERERQKEAERTKKPEIYYKAQAELR